MRKRLTLEVNKDGVTVMTGTVEEIADFFKLSPITIGNCERRGRKIHGEYEIERISQNGGTEWQK